MKLFDKTMTALQRSMDLRFKRHMVLTSNVANSETPGYRARDVNFAGELDRILSHPGTTLDNKVSEQLLRTDDSHLVFDDSGTMKSDGNNVDLDIQMGKISTNAQEFGGAALLLSMKLRLLKLAARGRGF